MSDVICHICCALWCIIAWLVWLHIGLELVAASNINPIKVLSAGTNWFTFFFDADNVSYAVACPLKASSSSSSIGRVWYPWFCTFSFLPGLLTIFRLSFIRVICTNVDDEWLRHWSIYWGSGAVWRHILCIDLVNSISLLYRVQVSIPYGTMWQIFVKRCQLHTSDH